MSILLRRRAFITLLGGAAAWPLAAGAQQNNRVRRVCGLRGGPRENDPLAKSELSAFTQALADLGWTDGRNVRIDVHWAGGDTNPRALAQELFGLQPDIILTIGATVTVTVQRETRTIPIVFAYVGDPVASGIVARLDRPSGNVTGFAHQRSLAWRGSGSSKFCSAWTRQARLLYHWQTTQGYQIAH